jgi:E3 ubiquitin-protein ligase UBR7
VTGEEPAEDNKYNQNFGNRFCGCGEEYNAHTEKGTMFQCLGLGSVDDGGCGEDWWHPECLVGLPRGWWKKNTTQREAEEKEIKEDSVAEHVDANVRETPHSEEEDAPLPPGFPSEDDFDGLLCYKCVNAFPYLKRYAGTDGFLPAVHHNPPTGEQPKPEPATSAAESRKHKAEDDEEGEASTAKRQRGSPQQPNSATPATNSLSKQPGQTNGDTVAATDATLAPPPCLYNALPPTPASTTSLSILLHPTFRDHLCRCPAHFPLLTPHPQLLDEEEAYEPPISESSEGSGPQSAGSKSLLDRGEAALSNMDRVRAIEGVMVYNHLRDKVKDFLQPFAESGKAVGAEDIKKYFETLRGDAEAMKEMRARQANGGGGGGDGDNRREQGGY